MSVYPVLHTVYLILYTTFTIWRISILLLMLSFGDPRKPRPGLTEAVDAKLNSFDPRARAAILLVHLQGMWVYVHVQIYIYILYNYIYVSICI